MRDQVGVDLDGFPLDHEFPDDYGLEKEDECDIEVEPLFEDELANQTAGPKPKRKSNFFASVGETLDKTQRRAPSKSIQPFELVCTTSFMSARSFHPTNL
ncbi:hypothetical protein VPH35_021005 [Triticum aestivum]